MSRVSDVRISSGPRASGAALCCFPSFVLHSSSLVENSRISNGCVWRSGEREASAPGYRTSNVVALRKQCWFDL